MRVEFREIINALADESGREISSTQIFQTFEQEYLEQTQPHTLETFHVETLVGYDSSESVACTARLSIDGEYRTVHARGNGPIDAFVRALNQEQIANFQVLSYAEHALSQGAEAQAVAYIQIQTETGQTFFGAAIDTNINLASMKALLSALNRSIQKTYKG